MHFSDVYADHCLPDAMARDGVLYGQCLSGSLYWNDFLSFAKVVGFTDQCLVTHCPITIENPVLEAAVVPLKFTSATYWLWKLAALDWTLKTMAKLLFTKVRLRIVRMPYPYMAIMWLRLAKSSRCAAILGIWLGKPDLHRILSLLVISTSIMAFLKVVAPHYLLNQMPQRRAVANWAFDT